MSVKISGQVWELDLDPIDKLVLLALADHADHEGNNIRPGNDLLCAKTGLSHQTISAKFKKFTEVGLLTPTNTFGRGRNREFTINLDAAERHQYFVEKERRKMQARRSFTATENCKHGAPLEAERCKLTEQKVQADSGKVQADRFSHDKERARVEPSEPSINRQEEEKPSPIVEALEEIYPGHATNFKTISEMFSFAERIKATAAQVMAFPTWLKKNHPMKANSPYAFRDLFAESISGNGKTGHGVNTAISIGDSINGKPRFESAAERSTRRLRERDYDAIAAAASGVAGVIPAD